MAGSTTRRISHFRDDVSRARFLSAYDAMLATWPRPPEPRLVETGSGPTHVQALPDGDRRPIVLLQALGVSSASSATLAAACAAAGHPVFAIDTVTDAGRSTQTAPVRTAAQLTSWLEQVLDGLDLDRVHLVGASYGAWMALRHALDVPSRVASVTAMDPPAAFGRPPAAFVLSMVRGGISAKLDRSDATLHKLLRQLHNGVLPSDPLLELSVASIRGFVVRQPFPKRLSDAELGSLTAPVLYLVGDATPIVDAARAAARARRLIPNVEIEVLAGAGHALPIERADEVEARVLGFVAAVDGCSCSLAASLRGAGRPEARHAEIGETHPSPTTRSRSMYQQIVVGTDGSPGATIAVDHAMELARLSGATLHIVSAHRVTTPYQLAAASEVGMAAAAVGESNEAVHADAQRICDHAVDRAKELGVTAESHCVPGDAADALLTVAKDTGCDLLVVGNRGMTGVRRFVLGSVPNKLSHNSPASLLIVDTSTAR